MDTAGRPDELAFAPPSRAVRWGLLAFGLVNVALGVAGTVLPVMPTTVFLLIALWAFSKSSLRFHRWLYDHPRLGRTLRAWHAHGVIPLRAKLLAVACMMASLAYVTFFVAEDWTLPIALALLFSAVIGFILSRPGAAPAAPASDGFRLSSPAASGSASGVRTWPWSGAAS